MATALAAEACRRGKRVRFWRVTELITQLLEAGEERVLLRLKAQLARLDLLVLDEFGYVPASKVGAELLFDVISTAYERTSVIVTTNLPFEQWTEVLGSERLVGATLDRLTHRCHILEATGESYRLRDAKRRQGCRPEGPAAGTRRSGRARLRWAHGVSPGELTGVVRLITGRCNPQSTGDALLGQRLELHRQTSLARGERLTYAWLASGFWRPTRFARCRHPLNVLRGADRTALGCPEGTTEPSERSTSGEHVVERSGVPGPFA